MELGGKVVNQVNALLVNELGNYFILRSSLLAKSLHSIWYRATHSTVDSPTSPANFVNLGTIHPYGNSVCMVNAEKGDTK